jgi:hypothetical protein
MTMCVGNMGKEENHWREIRPVKLTQRKRIDGGVALIDAICTMERAADDGVSVYEPAALWRLEGNEMPRITAPVRDSAIEARRDEFLTVKEYAFMVKQNPESVRRRLRAGRQPGAVRVGGQWRIDVAIASPARVLGAA